VVDTFLGPPTTQGGGQAPSSLGLKGDLVNKDVTKEVSKKRLKFKMKKEE